MWWSYKHLSSCCCCHKISVYLLKKWSIWLPNYISGVNSFPAVRTNQITQQKNPLSKLWAIVATSVKFCAHTGRVESAHQQFATNSKRIRSCSRGDGTPRRKQSRALGSCSEKVLGARGFIFLSAAAGGERNFTFQRAPRTKFLSAIAPEAKAGTLSSRAAGFDWLACRTETSICKTLPIARSFWVALGELILFHSYTVKFLYDAIAIYIFRMEAGKQAQCGSQFYSESDIILSSQFI